MTRRRDERKREIRDLRVEGALAYRAGKHRTSVPWKAYESTNSQHWLNGYDQAAEEDRQAEVDKVSNLARAKRDLLFLRIQQFDLTGERKTLTEILFTFANQLEF